MPTPDPNHSLEAPGSDLRYFVTTARSLRGFDLSDYPENSLWALLEFEDLVRLIQAPPSHLTPAGDQP